MEEISLSNSEDSFEHLSKQSDSTAKSDILRRSSSADSFLEIDFEECIGTGTNCHTQAYDIINDQEFEQVAELLSPNSTRKVYKSLDKVESVKPSIGDTKLSQDVPVPIRIKQVIKNVSPGGPLDVKVKQETQDLVSSKLGNKPRYVPLAPKLEIIVAKEETPAISVKVEDEYPLNEIKVEKAESRKRAPEVKGKKRKSKYELIQEKKQKRLIRNRASAKLHREKQKEKQKLLSSELKKLEEENAALNISLSTMLEENCLLKASLAEKDAENAVLKHQIYQLRKGQPESSELNQDLFYDVESPTPFSSEDDNTSLETDNASIFSRFIGSVSSDVSDLEDNTNSNKRKKLGTTGTVALNKKKGYSREKKGVYALFAFSFLFGLFNFDYSWKSEHVPLQVIEVTNLSDGNETSSFLQNDNLRKKNDLTLYGSPRNSDYSLSLEPINVHFGDSEWISGGNDDRFYVPFTTGKMIDLVNALVPKQNEKDGIVLSTGRALVPKTNIPPIYFSNEGYRGDLWREFNRLNKILQARPTYVKGRESFQLDSQSRAISIYGNHPSSKQLIALEAVQTVIKTYISYLQRDSMAESILTELDYETDNFVLCPTAYGALTGFHGDRVGKFSPVEENNYEKKSTIPREIGAFDNSEGFKAGKQETNFSEISESDSLLRIVLPSQTISTDSSAKRELVELVCRVEGVKHYFTPNQ